MAKFMYLYSGGTKPTNEDEAKAYMAAWAAYFAKLGQALVDPGTPLVPTSKVVGSAKTSGATGFSIIQAASLEEATALTTGHPYLANGGGIEVFEYAPMPKM